MPRVMQVIETDIPRGKGIVEDPARRVMQYHTLDGELLAEYDQWQADEYTRLKAAERLNSAR